ncbi:MAG: DNA recombination protein RmuC, partial [Candidatus Omnitrophica bacterium]|nr:DNA recombination protein RmuC [Candidatus Omnitrophota bacterium]
IILILISLLITNLFLVFRLSNTKHDLLLHQKIDDLKDNFTKSIFLNQTEVSKNLLSEFSKLYEKIGSLDRESNEILNLTRSFYDIFKPNKRRGILGESILENLIKDVLPQEVIFPQYTFRNGKKVDFAIKLKEGIIPIDAKFSLDVFKNYLEAAESEKEKYKKIFIDSLKARIDETSNYILPDEKTLDFSLMYLPSEALYYFIITETSLLEYAQKKKVFIVGPNTFYAYLKTILIGFEALKIEEKAKEIYNNLARLNDEVVRLFQDYVILGTHLRNASLKYEEVRKKVEILSGKIANIVREDL